MNTKQIAILALLPLTLSAAPAQGPATDDAKLLQGVWLPMPVKSQFGGKAFAPTTIATMKLTVTDENYEFVEGPTVDDGQVILRPNLRPKEMDIVGVKGPNAGKTIPAIYRFEHGRLTVCYGIDGHRPKEFRSPKKSMVLLAVFKRDTSSKQ